MWWIATATGLVQPQTLISPYRAATTLVSMFRTDNLAYQIAVSLERSAIGLVIGVGLGLVLGILTGLSALGEELLDSSMQMLRTVPFLALVPLMIVWLGIGETPKIAIIALATVFPIYLNTSNGVRNVDKKVVETAHSYGLSKLGVIREVILPLAMPQIFTGLRFSLGVSVLALVAAEQINATAGIGHLVSDAESYAQTDVLLVCVLIYCGLGLIGDVIVRILEHILLPWRAGVAAR
jgi:sulfonate transport system permease protein